MKQTAFKLKGGLLGMPTASRAMLLDDLLEEARRESSDEHRELLMDHGLLAVVAEYQARYNSASDYGVDDFARAVYRRPRFFRKLVQSVREVLRLRFVEDAAGAS